MLPSRLIGRLESRFSLGQNFYRGHSFPWGIDLELFFALGFAVFAMLIWFVFLRTVPVLHAKATVTSKVFTPETIYWQFQPGERHGFRTPTAIPIAEGYKLSLEIDGMHESADAGVSVLDADTFQVGTRVSIEYCKRGVPLLWKRLYVLKVSSIEGKSV